ncbi:hypothetical protein R3P38DRAFT_2570986 [Favolaschia claudopus]|uniref:Uncharacterized protein n=1 Tax=Favolaschia claudopus TaxID=2862362 RepID=A0AAV9ZTF2_9AGAR
MLPFHGHFRQENRIFTVYFGNPSSMDKVPSPDRAPSPDHTTMNGDYRHPCWVSPYMPYLLFLPATNPFMGTLFGRLNVTAGSPLPPSCLPIPIVGNTMIPEQVKAWAILEDALRKTLCAMFAEYPEYPFERMLSPPYPSHFGYKSTGYSTPQAMSAAIRSSRDAFLPLIATIAMMFALLDHRRPHWRARVLQSSRVHPQWFADLEESAAGPRFKRTGGIIDLTFRTLSPSALADWGGKHPLDEIISAVFGRIEFPLYFHWGVIDDVPKFPIPAALATRKFYPDRQAIKFLHSIQGQCSSSYTGWDCESTCTSQRDVGQTQQTTPPNPGTSPLSPDAPAAPPGQPIPEVEKGSGQKPGETVRDFMARRRAEGEKAEASETPENRRKRLDRLAHASKGNPPGRKGARVFVWEESLECPGFFIRHAMNRTNAADSWEEYTPTQRFYNSWRDEWDLCTALDPGAEPEQEPYDEDDSDDYMRPGPTKTKGNVDMLSVRPDVTLSPRLQTLDVNDRPPPPSTSFIAMKDVAYARFGFTTPTGPGHKYEKSLRPDYTARFIGDEHWLGVKDPSFALLPTFFAFLLEASSLAQIPKELIDLRSDTADIASNVWTVDVKSKSFGGTRFYIIHPRHPEADPNFCIILQSAVTTLQIIRMGWGFHTVDNIAYHLRLQGIEYHVCTIGPYRPQALAPVFCTGLGFRPVNYKPTRLDYVAYTTLLRKFIKSPRGQFARCAGGVVSRLAFDDDDNLIQCPSDGVFETGKCFWDGQSDTAYYADTLTPQEIDLICGVYVVETGQPIALWLHKTHFEVRANQLSK